MSCNQHNKACKSCPFSRQCEPGALGGSPIETYLGQIVGPFFLPCHSCDGYKGNNTQLGDVANCAGAEIFRRNIGVDHLMPDAIKQTDPDATDPNVFASLSEFVEHHTGDKIDEHALQYSATYHLRVQMGIAQRKGRIQPAK